MSACHLAILFLLASPAAAFGQSPDPSGLDWQRAEDLFLPALDYARHDVEEWRLRVERTFGRDYEALWALYYHDDRSPEVLQTLREIASNSYHEETLLEVQTILNQWGEPYLDRRLRFDSRWPGRLLTSSNTELLERLEDESVERRSLAALTLISRQLHVDRAVRVLLERSALTEQYRPQTEEERKIMDWARLYSGSAWDEALLGMLADPSVPLSLKDLLLGRRRITNAAVMENAVPLFGRLGLDHPSMCSKMLFAMSNLAREDWLGGHLVDWNDWRREGRYQASYNRVPLASERLDELLATHLPPLLDDLLATNRLQEVHLLAAAAAALRGELLRAAIIPRLRRLLERDDALSHRALWLLCHLGQSDAEIRRRYVELVEALNDHSGEALEEVPCLPEHDERTLRVLEELYRSVPARDLAFKLAAGGLLDTDRSWIARDLVERHELEVLRWWWLDSCPVRAVWQPRPEDDRATAALLLGVTIRTKRERSEDASAEFDGLLDILRGGYHQGGGGGPGDYWLRCLSVIDDLDLESDELRRLLLEILINVQCFGDQQRMAARILLRRELTRREQAVLCHFESLFRHVELYRLLSAQGEASIEVVAGMRRTVYRPDDPERWTVDTLDYVLDITRMSREDEALLIAAMKGGLADERRRALEIVSDHELDSPALKPAILLRRDDCDAETAALADQLARQRGWINR